MKKVIIFLLLTLFVLTVSAQSYPCQKQIEKEQYDKAKESINKNLGTHPEDITYLFADYKLSSVKTYRLYNPRYAYKQLVKAMEQFNMLDPKKQDKLIKKGFTTEMFVSEIILISHQWLEYAKEQHTDVALNVYIEECQLAPEEYKQEAIRLRNQIVFAGVKKNDMVETYNQFIATYPNAEQIAEAIELRNAAAYRDAKQLNTIEAYKEFITTYPQATQVIQARAQMSELAFKVAENENTEDAYRRFLDEYYDSKEAPIARNRANQFQYLHLTAANNIEVYLDYISRFPMNEPQLRQARKTLLQIALKDEKNTVLSFPKGEDPIQRWLNEEDSMYAYPKEENIEKMVDLGQMKVKTTTETIDYLNCSVCYVNGKAGVVTEDKRVCVPFIYDDIIKIKNSNSSLFTKRDAKVGLLTNMREIYPPIMDRISTYPLEVTDDKGQNIKFKDYPYMYQHAELMYTREHNLVGFNPTNDELTTLEVDKYMTDYAYSDGMLALYNVGTGLWGFVNSKGEMQIPQILRSTKEPHFANGYCLLYEDNKIRVIDKEGNTTAQLTGKYTYLSDFNADGLAFAVIPISTTQCRYALINTEGKELFPALYNGKRFNISYGYYPQAFEFHDNVAFYVINTSNGLRYGLYNSSGKVVMQPSFEAVHEFSEGLAAVKVAVNANQPAQWGYINTVGEWVIPAQFTNEPDDFHEGLALVRKSNGNWVYIDTLGQVVSDEYESATSFYQGHAFVKIPNSLDYQVINRHFTVISHDKILMFSYQEKMSNICKHGLLALNYMGIEACNGGVNGVYDAKGDLLKFDRPFFFKVKLFSDDMIYIEYYLQEGDQPLNAFMDYSGKIVYVLKEKEF